MVDKYKNVLYNVLVIERYDTRKNEVRDMRTYLKKYCVVYKIDDVMHEYRCSAYGARFAEKYCKQERGNNIEIVETYEED